MPMHTPTHVRPLVALNQVSFQFANGSTLFENLHLKFDTTPTAIVGRNGTGKSVLAQLLAGRLTPTSGHIERNATLAYVAQHTQADDAQTVADLAGVAPVLQALHRLQSGAANMADIETIADRWDMAQRFRAALDDAGLQMLEFDTTAAQLSGGQRARVALIGAFLSQADGLLLDEPSNHLDAQGRAWLSRMLQQWHGGIIVISHDRQLLRQMQKIVELSSAGAHVYGCDYPSYRQQRQTEQQAAVQTLEHARTQRLREQKRLQREHDTIQRRAGEAARHADTANVSRPERFGMKNAAREIMGHIRHQQQEYKDALNAQVRVAASRVQAEETVLMSLPGTVVPAQRRLFTLEQVQLPWLNPQHPSTHMTWTLEGPVRVAISGPNGCGKSTLLKLLAAQLSPLRGVCSVHVPCAYLDQQLDLLNPDLSVLEQLQDLQTPLAEGTLRSRLALLQLDARRVNLATRHLSGGERLKAAIACALWRANPTQMLLLDEPTSHLDLESILAFETVLQTFPGAIIAVSHDEDFLQALQPTHALRWSEKGWLGEVK